MNVSFPKNSDNSPTLPQTANESITLVLNELPYSKKYLMEISNLLHSPRKKDLLRKLSSRANLVPLLKTCANESELGRKILTDLARANSTFLKLFLDHGLLLDLDPVLRISCVQTIYDLIDEIKRDDAKCELESRYTEKSAIRFAEQEDVNFVERKSLSKNIKFSVKDELKSGSLNLESLCGMRSSNLLPLVLPAFNLESTMNSIQIIAANDDLLSPLSTGLTHMISEDFAPDLRKKGSSAWFLSDTNGISNTGPRINPALLNIDSDSETEEPDLLSPADKWKQEEDWLESIRSTEHSLPSEPRASILKSSLSFSTKQSESEDVQLKISDSPEKAFMWKLVEFGLLTAVSDLATLDPFPKSRALAERTLGVLFQRAPNSLLHIFPSKFGQFSRVMRQLKLRSVSRPIHLDKTTRQFMKEIYGELAGRTLVVGAGSGAFAERLMSYFHGHCRQNALELVISFLNDPISHIARYPGFADTHHKLSQCSTVNFHDEREYKEFDPSDIPNALTPAFKARSSMPLSQKVMFDVDPTKLSSEALFKDSIFHNVIWNFPGSNQQVGAIIRKSLLKDLVSSFLLSVKDILDPNGFIHISLHDEKEDAVQCERWDLNEVAKEASLCIVRTMKAPRFFYSKDNSSEQALTNSNATIYVLCFIGSKALHLFDDDDDDDSYSETYSEPSS